ncbi:MAG: hypothetical protein KAT05_02280, partial [Spirochaetes bacterium]|nr:hypothetical protein [Spirochaetota bacterium]
FPLGVIGADSRSLLIDPVTYETKDLHGGDGESKLKKRKDFRPTAVFKPYLKTNENGIVKVSFKLPDTLTTYRCTAIAVKDNYFGIKENEIKVQNPINVRTALPRRLRIRDTAFAGVIVTNLDSDAHKITVSISSDLLTIQGEHEKSIELPPKSRVEIPFKIVALHPGEATITFKTISDILKEELEVKLQIEKPIVKEAFTTIGMTKQDKIDLTKTFAQEGLIIPKNIGAGYGGLTIRLDSTKMTNLSESINYLYSYPYLCLEQRSSKIFSLVVFGDKVKPFIKVSNPKGIIENELKYWAKFQNSDGGFPYWLKGGYESGKFISIKVAKLLYFAKINGIKIPSSINMDRLLSYISKYDKYTGDYLKLYSLYVQSLYGKNVILKADEYHNRADKIGLYGYAFLGLIYLNNNDKTKANQCLIKLKNFIKVGTQTIDIVDPAHRYYFSSQINDLSLLLMLYDKFDPKSEFINRIINTLMQRQKNGYWNNTVSTEWVVQAFAQVYEKETGKDTNFTAKINIDDKNFIETIFKGANNKTYVKDLSF